LFRREIAGENVKQDSEAPDLLREYLLGRLTEDQQESVDKQLMTGKEFIDRIRTAEEELADEYAAGALHGPEKERFENIFLAHPSRRQQTAFAHALRRYLGSARVKQPARGNLIALLRIQSRSFQAACVAALLLMVVGGLWLALTANRLRHERDAMAAEQRIQTDELQRGQTEKARLENQVRNLESGGAEQQPPVTFVAAALIPGQVRDAGGKQRIILSPDKTAIRLELLLDSEAYSAYNAVIEREDGSLVWSQKGLQVQRKAGGSVVIVLLSREALSPKDYVLKLAGIRADGIAEPAASYYFRTSAQ